MKGMPWKQLIISVVGLVLCNVAGNLADRHTALAGLINFLGGGTIGFAVVDAYFRGLYE